MKLGQIGNISVCFYLIFGLLFMLITPPFEEADAPNHFYRCYQLSEGTLISQKKNNLCGGEVPKSLKKTIHGVMKGIPFHPEVKQDINDVLNTFSFPLEKSKTEFMEFSNTALYNIVPYIPQIIGISIGKIFNLPPIMLMYLARFFNLLLSASIIIWAIRITPVFKNIFFLLAFMPMTIFLTASISPDAMTIGLAFLLISMILKLTYTSDTRLDNKNKLLLLSISVLLTFCKSVYFLIPFLYFLIPSQKAGSKKKYYAIAIVLSVLVFGSLIWWGKIIERIYVPILPDVGFFPSIQIAKKFILRYPFYFIQVIINSLVFKFPDYIHSFIGKMGWLDTNLPIPFVIVYIFALILTASLNAREDININIFEKILIAGIALGSVFLVITSQFIIWTPVGAEQVGGLQGRYFIPVGILFFLLLYNTRLSNISDKNKIDIFTYLVVLFSLIYTLGFVFRRYYI